MDKVRKFLGEWGTVLVIVALAALLCFQAITGARTNSRITRESRSVLPVACQAVKVSTDAIEKFIRDESATGPRKNDPATEAFIGRLHTTLLTAQVKCLTGGK